jgi:hypothetical protein
VQVCGPFFSAHKNRIMNAIAAHRHELERLLKDLSGDIASAGITFVTLVDAYITRLDANCPGTSAGVNPVPAHINRRIKTEPTLTQNCALYYAQHKSSKPRASFFQRFRAAARKQTPETYQQLTHGTRFRRLPFHRDNGR